jgi:hypothetical protein
VGSVRQRHRLHQHLSTVNTVLLIDKPIKEWKVYADSCERDGLRFGLAALASVSPVGKWVYIAERIISPRPYICGREIHSYTHAPAWFIHQASLYRSHYLYSIFLNYTHLEGIRLFDFKTFVLVVWSTGDLSPPFLPGVLSKITFWVRVLFCPWAECSWVDLK